MEVWAELVPELELAAALATLSVGSTAMQVIGAVTPTVVAPVAVAPVVVAPVVVAQVVAPVMVAPVVVAPVVVACRHYYRWRRCHFLPLVSLLCCKR